MNILIVGGAGYIGSHMVKYLTEQTKHQVVVLDNLSKGHRGAVLGTELVEGDFGDAALVSALCRERHIEGMMHFGADSLVAESVSNPAKYYENNVVKGKLLIDAGLSAGVKQVIFSSTASTYGMPEQVPITEEAITRPINPYGRSKLAFEGLLESYADAYELRYTSLRYFNACGADPAGLIGEAHAPETHLIPNVLQVALGQREQITVYGDDYPTSDGTCIRDYIHVNDLVSAHLLALERLCAGGASGVYNLGNGQGFSVREIVEECRAVTGHPIPARMSGRRPGDPAVLIAGAARAQRELGWRPYFPTSAKSSPPPGNGTARIHTDISNPQESVSCRICSCLGCEPHPASRSVRPHVQAAQLLVIAHQQFTVGQCHGRPIVWRVQRFHRCEHRDNMPGWLRPGRACRFSRGCSRACHRR